MGEKSHSKLLFGTSTYERETSGECPRQCKYFKNSQKDFEKKFRKVHLF
jgi:hypothetical protein